MSARINAALQQNPTIIICGSGDHFSQQARDLLSSKGIAHEVYAGDSSPDLVEDVRNTYGHRTFPMIFVDRQFVGGYAELAERLR
ncbi:glutaredoxin [Streptomyces sp. 1222.5]|uniref:glutaredoxin n=1 Tax=Streptomyces sp. 1222.5 TaxID=1881026 RepID=UPI003D70F0F6